MTDAQEAPPPRRRRLTRRKFLLGAGAAVGACAVCGPLYAFHVEPHWIDVARRSMPLAGLDPRWDGRTIAHISDLHVGKVVDRGYIEGAMRRVNALKPDMIAITGDFMTCMTTEQIDATIEVLGQLDRPPRGILAVPGNHDYGVAFTFRHVADRLSERLEAIGVRMLRNEAIDVEGLPVLGLDDVDAGRIDVAAAVGQLDGERDAVALLHNPDGVDLGGWAGFGGWILAGHTHGGQVDLPFMTPPVLPIRNKRYAEGRVALDDGRTLYVNRGLGYLKPVRFCSRPEITLFTLRPKG